MISKKARLTKVTAGLVEKLWMQDWSIDIGLATTEELAEMIAVDEKSDYNKGAGTDALTGCDPYRRKACVIVHEDVDPRDYAFLVAHELIHDKLEMLFREFEINATFTMVLEHVVDDLADAVTGGRVAYTVRSNKKS